MGFSPRDDKDPQEAKVDRRVHPRQALTPRLYVILDAAKTDGILNDVSEGGAALEIVGPLPEGEYFAVDFEMSEIGQHFEARGRIAWRDDESKKVGVQFPDLPEASRAQIRQWLSKKTPPSQLTRAPVLPALARDTQLQSPPAPRPVPPPGDAAPVAEPASGPPLQPANELLRQAPSETEGDHLVQNLIDSFSKPQKRSREVSFTAVPSIFSPEQTFSSPGKSRWWIALSVTACVALLLALGFVAYRLPARNGGVISVSKAGRPPNADADTATLGGAANNGSGKNSNNHTGGIAGGSGGGDDGASGNRPPTTALLSTLPSASTPGHPPCVNLGAPSDKIRIYLWAEKGTPNAIVATYAKNLNAVQDVRVVDHAPYDLVLYVNGANVDAKRPEAAYIWSSRVFRSWYCGETPGLLEQTEVNESLHYVQGDSLDQRVQAEVAYLILHTFESIRKQQPNK